MFDALDLEYALLRAAARGSVGPYSLSESLHKLTFTQSLAFPALARGLASKQSVPTRRPQQHTESGLNAFAKVVTALVLVLVSVLVFGVVYKFVRTWGWLLVPDRPAGSTQEFDRPGTSDAFDQWLVRPIYQWVVQSAKSLSISEYIGDRVYRKITIEYSTISIEYASKIWTYERRLN